MIKMTAKIKLTPEEIIKRAVSFFGPGGHGLELKEQAAGIVYFEGGGGCVEVTASAEGKVASVSLFSREWDYQVKEFLKAIT